MRHPRLTKELRRERSYGARPERRRVALPGFLVLADGSTAELRVADLSCGGCGIETDCPLKVGDAVKISVSNRGTLDAIVRWSGSGRAGLLFESHKKGSTDHKLRENERVPVNVDILARHPGRPKFSVRVFDLTAQGCSVEFVERPREGDHVFLTFPGLEAIGSQVRWVKSNRAGVYFDRPIHAAVFDFLLKKIRVLSPVD